MTLTRRPARFTAVLRPSPRLPPLMIATLSFIVSFAIATPLLFASDQCCVLYSMILRNVFYTVSSLTVGRGRVRSLFSFEIGPSFKVGNNPRLLRLPFQLFLS